MAAAPNRGERRSPLTADDGPRETILAFVLFAALAAAFLHGALTGPRLLAAEGGEALGRYYPVRHVYGRMLSAGEFPLWNPFAFIGQPFWARYDAGALYPPNLALYFFLPAPAAFDAGMVLHVALAGFFAYLLARALGAGRAGAAGGGIIFGMTGFMLAARDLTPVVDAAAWLPLALWCAERLRRAPGMRTASALALPLALQALAGDPLVALLSAALAVAFVALGGAHEPGRSVAAPAWALLGTGLAGLLALPQIVAAWGSFSMVAAYALEPLAHFPPAALVSFFVPGAPAGGGDAIAPLLGPLPLALALATALVLRSQQALFLAGLGLVGTILALAPETPLRAIPLIGALPAPGRMLLPVSLAVAMLAALGLDAILGRAERERALAIVTYALGAALGLVLAGALALLAVGRADIVPPGATVPAIATIALALGWAVWFRRAGGQALGHAALALFLLEAVAMGGFGGPRGPSLADARDLCAREPFGAFTSADPGLYRLAAISMPGDGPRTNPGAALTCAIGSIALADPAVDRDYARLLDLVPGGDGSRRWPDLVRNNIVLGMLGVRYLMVPSDAEVGIEGVPIEEGGAIRERVAVSSWLPYLARPAEDGGSFVLDPGGEIASSPIELEEAVYGVSFGAHAPSSPPTGPLLVLIVRTDGSDAVEAERIEPGSLGAEPREFFVATTIEVPGSYRIVIQSRSETPLLVGAPRVMRLNHYAPFSLAEGGPAMDGMEAYEKLWDDGSRSLWTNRNALPRAWPVGELIETASAQLAKNMLYTFQANPARQAMLGPEDLKAMGSRIFARGAVDIKGYAPGRIALATDFPEDGFVVLSEMHDPGWEARIDGTRAPIYRTDGVLMGIVVPRGRHEVAFRFFPRGTIVLAAFSLALALALLWRAARPRRERRDIPDIA